MKVSIIVPALNEAKTISATIEALLKQDYPSFEIIVVDNASTDNTSDVASQFPVKVVQESRKGLLFARECGRMNASGEIIANTDADCLPAPDWLSKGVSYFSNPKIIAVTGPCDFYDGTWLFRRISFFAQKYGYRLVSALFQSPLLKMNGILIGGNNFIRADVLKKTGGYNTELTFYGEDTDTAKRISKHGKIAFSPKVITKTSARRFKSEGTFKIILIYWYHFMKHVFSKTKKS